MRILTMRHQFPADVFHQNRSSRVICLSNRLGDGGRCKNRVERTAHLTISVLATIAANSSNDSLPSPSLSASMIVLSTICCSCWSFRRCEQCKCQPLYMVSKRTFRLFPTICFNTKNSSPLLMNPSLSISYTLKATKHGRELHMDISAGRMTSTHTVTSRRGLLWTRMRSIHRQTLESRPSHSHYSSRASAIPDRRWATRDSLLVEYGYHPVC